MLDCFLGLDDPLQILGIADGNVAVPLAAVIAEVKPRVSAAPSTTARAPACLLISSKIAAATTTSKGRTMRRNRTAPEPRKACRTTQRIAQLRQALDVELKRPAAASDQR
jgi:hypothetical protein